MYNDRRVNSVSKNTISQPRKMHIRYVPSADYPPETAVTGSVADRKNQAGSSKFSTVSPFGLDAETLLLTAIIVLLISENADKTLILALVYILAS